MSKIVLCDIDGTIADITRRLHYIQNKPKNWDAFYDEVDKDVPISHIIELVKSLCIRYPILFVSGRRESTRDKTEAWLKDKFEWIENLYLYMRGDEDYREDYIVKKELLERIKKDFPTHEILFAIDDRNQVVKMWRENGIPCLQVKEGDY